MTKLQQKKNKASALKRFTHNVLDWAKPVDKSNPNGGDSFQPTYMCECGVACTQDSQGNWFHLDDPNRITNLRR